MFNKSIQILQDAVESHKKLCWLLSIDKTCHLSPIAYSPALAFLVSVTPPILWPMLNITHNAFISLKTPEIRRQQAERRAGQSREVESESGEWAVDTGSGWCSVTWVSDLKPATLVNMLTKPQVLVQLIKLWGNEKTDHFEGTSKLFYPNC